MKTVLSKTNKLHLVALLFTLFSFSVCAQIPNTTLNELKVMTWNVWYGFSQLTASSGKLPADHPFIASQTEVQQKATSFLLTEAPDVLALQELNGFDANSLASFATSYGHNYSYIFDRDNKQSTGVTSKYPLEFLEGQNGTYNGTNLEGTFAIKLQNQSIVFIVVHLNSANKSHRLKESNYVLELYNKYRELNNHVVLLGDFNSMTITDRAYAETKIDKRLKYRIFKDKCKHELNKVNQPDAGMAACTTWDYSVMDLYWNYIDYPIKDTTNEFANRESYVADSFWGTFPSSSVKLFHDTSNLDHENNSTTTHLQEEHLARIDYVLASTELASFTSDARIIHSYTNTQNQTILIDEMSDHYPVSTTFKASNLSIIKPKMSINISPNPLKGNILRVSSYSADINSAVLFDVTGRKIMDVVIQNDLINFNSLLEGVYLLQFNTGLVKRILKY